MAYRSRWPLMFPARSLRQHPALNNTAMPQWLWGPRGSARFTYPARGTGMDRQRVADRRSRSPGENVRQPDGLSSDGHQAVGLAGPTPLSLLSGTWEGESRAVIPRGNGKRGCAWRLYRCEPANGGQHPRTTASLSLPSDCTEARRL